MIWDVIVIGAGIEGSATAYTLAKDGRRTLVLEQFFLPHSRGSSHGQSRITRKAYPEDFYAKMMVYGFEAWKKLEQEEGIQLYLKTGLLTVSKSDSKELTETENSLRAIGSKFDRFDSKGLRERFRTLHFDPSDAAVFDPDGGMLLADKCLRAYQNQFKKNGGVIHDGERVLQIVPSSKERVRVVTTKGEYLAGSVVVAAGAWSEKLLGTLDLHLPLKPKRVVIWYWKQLESGYGINEGFPCFLYVDGHDEIYGLPSYEYPGLVKVAFHGGHDLDDPERRDFITADDRYLRYAMNFVRRHLPGVEAKPSVAETCMYTNTPDTNFVLDRHPKWDNVIIGTGFSGHGFKMAPVVGRILSDLVAGKTSSFDLNPFKISRFSDQKSKV